MWPIFPVKHEIIMIIINSSSIFFSIAEAFNQRSAFSEPPEPVGMMFLQDNLVSIFEAIRLS